MSAPPDPARHRLDAELRRLSADGIGDAELVAALAGALVERLAHRHSMPGAVTVLRHLAERLAADPRAEALFAGPERRP